MIRPAIIIIGGLLAAFGLGAFAGLAGTARAASGPTPGAESNPPLPPVNETPISEPGVCPTVISPKKKPRPATLPVVEPDPEPPAVEPEKTEAP